MWPASLNGGIDGDRAGVGEARRAPDALAMYRPNGRKGPSRHGAKTHDLSWTLMDADRYAVGRLQAYWAKRWRAKGGRADTGERLGSSARSEPASQEIRLQCRSKVPLSHPLTAHTR